MVNFMLYKFYLSKTNFKKLCHMGRGNQRVYNQETRKKGSIGVCQLIKILFSIF